MNFNICSACKFFLQELKTEQKVRPKSCAHPELLEWFGENVGGFP